ncbi:Rhodanese-related sulfurtransferase [Psychrobacillus sp. OK028]|uniref:rhodanese-like domain-containing protein n=1 Tax=Psychrobacillus sp. OK028 TaxID=1884359 RepID=UPI0008919022|nr:rhodanese-like domain-containing protein [Psychrobacillus sp. OK028]SDN42569.1 Rhodanese-related sulfurtransferase [Psychrobacillus sp. OK028]
MKTILPEEVQAKLQAGEILNFIDVREVAEVEAGHIHGITNIPLGLLEFRMHELDKKTPYIMICRSGGRSGQATAFLESQGFDVTNMSGGMLEWTGEVK